MPGVASRLRQSALVLGFTLALGGCVVAPAPYYGGAAVTLAPPAPRVEYYGAAPYPGYFWIGGYWNWGGGRYVWVPGRWARPPYPRARWAPGHWGHDRHGYYWIDGRWR